MLELEQRVCKLPIEGRTRMCILKTEWDENSCTMYILLGNEVWIGSLWEEDVVQLSNSLSLSTEEYLSKTKHALTCHGGAENFIYIVDGNKFFWKMRTSSGMSIKYGSVELRIAQVSDVVESIIDSELDTNIQLNEELRILRKQKEELESEKLMLYKKLEELCELKKEMENTLYSKFLVLLNEKKKKIRELKRKLKSGEKIDEEEDEDNKNIVEQAVSDTSDHCTSETDVETDNEMSQTDMMFGKPKKGKEISPRKLKYSEAHAEDDESMAGPSGVKPAVKIAKLDDSNDCVNEMADALKSSKMSQKMNDSDSTSKIKINSAKSKSVFSQDTLKLDSFVNTQDLSPEEILRRLID